MTSTRFAMATHATALLAANPAGASSEKISASVGSPAVVLRRVLNRLRDAKLVETREGRSGGYRLKRPAAEITLAQVWRAVEAEPLFAKSPAEPSPSCPIGSGMRATFSRVAKEAESGMLAALAKQTVADVSREAQRQGKKRAKR